MTCASSHILVNVVQLLNPCIFQNLPFRKTCALAAVVLAIFLFLKYSHVTCGNPYYRIEHEDWYPVKHHPGSKVKQIVVQGQGQTRGHSDVKRNKKITHEHQEENGT